MKRFVDEAESSSDPSLKSSLLVSAASLIWKYKEEDACEEVAPLFSKALEAAADDARAARLYERVLRSKERWNELVQMLFDAAGSTSERDAQAALLTRAARVFKLKIGNADPGL